MSIFGHLAPKFISDNNDVVYMDYVNMESNWIIPDEIEHKSVITGAKSFITLGDYANFTVSINLFKYGSLTSMKSKFLELYSYNHKDVVFYPYRDGNPIMDKDGNTVLFHITSMKLDFISNINSLDLLTMTFESKKYIDLSKSIV